MPHRRWILSYLLAVACAPGRDAGRITTVRDSMDIQVVESSAPRSSEAPFTLSSAPVLDLGGVAGGLHEEFSGFVFPVRLSDGRLVVANGGSQELRVFDSRGVWQMSIGQRGEGPGEFRSLGWLHAGVGDTLRTYDWTLQRVSVFSPDGVFQRSYRLGRSGEGTSARPYGALADGRVIAGVSNAVTTSSRPGVHRDTVVILAFDASGEISDTVGRYPGQEDWIQRAEHSVLVADRPFGKKLAVVTHDSVVIIGMADTPELQVSRADGALLRIVRWTAPPAPVTAADIEAFVQEESSGWEPGSEAMRDRYLESLEQAPYPETMPAYTGIVLGADGTLLVRKYPGNPGDPESFDLFDPGGAWLGAVEMPARFTPTQITPEYAIGTWTDTDDVRHVRVYRIVRRSPGR